MFEQDLAGRRGHDAATMALQQRRMDLRLELSQALAEGRGADVLLLPGARQVAVLAKTYRFIANSIKSRVARLHCPPERSTASRSTKWCR